MLEGNNYFYIWDKLFYLYTVSNFVILPVDSIIYNLESFNRKYVYNFMTLYYNTLTGLTCLNVLALELIVVWN